MKISEFFKFLIGLEYFCKPGYCCHYEKRNLFCLGVSKVKSSPSLFSLNLALVKSFILFLKAVVGDFSNTEEQCVLNKSNGTVRQF